MWKMLYVHFHEFYLYILVFDLCILFVLILLNAFAYQVSCLTFVIILFYALAYQVSEPIVLDSI